MTKQNNNDTPIFSGGGSELYENRKSMQNNNEEIQKIIKMIDETIAYGIGGECGGRTAEDCKKDLIEIVAFQIQAAEQRGKREGLMIVRHILEKGGNALDLVVEISEKVDQVIKELK